MSDWQILALVIALVLTVLVLVAHFGDVIENWPRRARRRSSIYTSSERPPLVPKLAESADMISPLHGQSIAGMPIHEIRSLFNLDDKQMRTRADINRWRAKSSRLRRQLDAVDKLLDTKHEELLLLGEHHSDPIPVEIRSIRSRDDVA